MRSFAMVAMMLGLVCSSAGAQRTELELGMRAGAGIAWASGLDNEYFVGAPGAGRVSMPAIYVTWFALPHLMVEPQASIQYNNQAGSARLTGALQLAYFAFPGRKFSPYIGGNVGGYTAGDSLKTGTVGAAVGARLEFCTKIGLRFEGLYRKSLCDNCVPRSNEVVVSVGVGVLLR